jgi:hypothetical protein
MIFVHVLLKWKLLLRKLFRILGFDTISVNDLGITLADRYCVMTLIVKSLAIGVHVLYTGMCYVKKLNLYRDKGDTGVTVEISNSTSS